MSEVYPKPQFDRSAFPQRGEIALPSVRCQRTSVEDLAEMVQAELQTSRYSEVRRIECQIDHECIVLAGCVSSYYLKQMAQSQLFQSFGYALPIVNDLQVIPDDSESLPRRPR
jgi:hypothetical protein